MIHLGDLERFDNKIVEVYMDKGKSYHVDSGGLTIKLKY